MKPAILYRIASVLLALFALGHTLGFTKVDPSWTGADGVVSSMRGVHFNVQGFSRSYWDFFVGFGLFVTVLLVLAALLAWQLGGLPREVLAGMKLVTWGLALSFVAVTILSWKYFFIPPIVFSALVTLCLLLAAWTAGSSQG